MHPGREGLLLQALTLEVNGYCLQFKLAPAYSLYMVARYNLSASYNRAVERHQSLVQLLRSTCSLIKKAVKVVCLCVLCILYVSVCVRVCVRACKEHLCWFPHVSVSCFVFLFLVPLWLYLWLLFSRYIIVQIMFLFKEI